MYVHKTVDFDTSKGGHGDAVREGAVVFFVYGDEDLVGTEEYDEFEFSLPFEGEFPSWNGLFRTPTAVDQRVPDYVALLEARVEVEADVLVLPFATYQVYSESDKKMDV